MSLTAFLFVFSIFVFEADAQCVKCVPAPPGWICMGAGVGAQACAPEGESCNSIGTCSPELDRVGKEGDCSSKVLNYSLVNVSDNVIQDISQLNPRIALALISIRNVRVEFNQGKISFAPIEVSAEDVTKYLTLSKSSNYFEERKSKVREAFEEKREPIVYEYVLNRNGANSSLRIKAVDSAESSFEINLSEITVGRGDNQSIRFEATSWKSN